MKVNVNHVLSENLPLNIRQYDSGLNNQEISDIIDLLYCTKGDPNKPGYQCSIFGTPRDKILKEFDHPNFKKLEQSFVNACQQYWNLKSDYDVTGWVYISWTNIVEDLTKQGKKDDLLPFWHSHTSTQDCYRLSGVLYLTLPEGSETTTFSYSPDLSKGNFFKLPLVKNKWFIFPSMMPHLPGEPGKTNELRICVAADYWIL